MKKTIIMMLLAMVTMVASAETYSYLRFTYNDSTEVAYSVSGLIITYDNTNIYVNNNDGSATLTIADVAKMYFSNNGSTDEEHNIGDVNHDGIIDVKDVTALIAMILGNGTGCEICADVNGDGIPDVKDVTALIAIILGNSTTSELQMIIDDIETPL